MRIDPRVLTLIALSTFAGCGQSDPAAEHPPPSEIHWRGEETGYRGTTVTSEDGKPPHE